VTPLRLIVTTGPKPTTETRERGSLVAARLQAAFAPRSRMTLARLMREHDADRAYVVGRDKEYLLTPEGTLHAHPGMYYLKMEDGAVHPLIRAVQPDAAKPVERVLDGTLGMASDALHLAGHLGVEVVGVEASPVLASLLEEGLPRMARTGRLYAAAASRVSVQHGDATEVLATLGDNTVDVVYLDPMFDVPQKASASFSLVRQLADGRPVSARLLEEGVRVARRRLVLKVGATAEAPPFEAGPGWNRRVRGGAVDYLIIDHELTPTQCQWEEPTPWVEPGIYRG
jgi:16S rRNA (guanine1516-N2)-methyltransferase